MQHGPSRSASSLPRSARPAPLEARVIADHAVGALRSRAVEWEDDAVRPLTGSPVSGSGLDSQRISVRHGAPSPARSRSAPGDSRLLRQERDSTPPSAVGAPALREPNPHGLVVGSLRRRAASRTGRSLWQSNSRCWWPALCWPSLRHFRAWLPLSSTAVSGSRPGTATTSHRFPPGRIARTARRGI